MNPNPLPSALVEEVPPLITYPGITAEVVPNIVEGTMRASKRAYEAVFNCGGISVAPSTLRTEVLRASLERKFEMGIREILYVSDAGLLESETFAETERLFETFFPGKFGLVGVNRSSGTFENRFGLRVVVSEIDAAALSEGIEAFPEACTIASLPYADPDIAGQIENFRRDFGSPLSIKTLGLLARNDRKTPTEIAREFVGYVGRFDSKAELDAAFEAESNTVFVLKSVGHRAGGTSTQIVTPERREEFLKGEGEFPLIAYEFLRPCLLKTEDGKCFPVHVRPYCVGDRILGASIKMPAVSVHECVDAKTGEFQIPKMGLAKLNSRLNSSSGRSISAFVDERGNFVAGSEGMNKELSAETFASFRMLSGDISFGNPENVRTLMESCASLVRTVQARTNRLILSS